MRHVPPTMVDHNVVEMSRVPILVILGATGSGKSRLGIELARRFSGEIISADSMQVYKSLDIITAKVTKEEMEMVPHHMINIADPLTKFNVVDFRNMALPIMDDIMARKKMPIIVGGTNYYIESLLWDVLIDPEKRSWNSDSSNDENESLKNSSEDEESPVKKFKVYNPRVTNETNEELYRRLQEVDPEMAQRVHPNNRRKMQRSLEVFLQHGVTHSELLRKQRMAGGCGLGGPLRYPNSLILWLQCETEVLNQRLDSRVDGMLEAGLVQELLDFHHRYNEKRIKTNTSPDYTKGIFQSIGFKEFHDYLILPEEERKSEKGLKLLKKGIEDLKIVTRRYAKTQLKWVRNRLIRRADRQAPPVYGLDCTDVAKWDQNVLEPAATIVSAILQGEKPAQEPLKATDNTKTNDSSNESVYHCDVCKRFFVGTVQWDQHMKGVRHAKVLKKIKLQEERQQDETSVMMKNESSS